MLAVGFTWIRLLGAPCKQLARWGHTQSLVVFDMCLVVQTLRTSTMSERPRFKWGGKAPLTMDSDHRIPPLVKQA